MTPKLAGALSYASMGWPCIPLHSASAGGCTCGRLDCSSPAKHPRTPNGLTNATTDLKQVAAWWRWWPDANVGVVTGAASGLLVVDVDGPEGEATLLALQARHGALPATRWVRTGSGGWHAYFRHPGGRLGNSAGRLGPKLDTRGDGGYVVAPPSRHASGGLYTWHSRLAPIAPLPSWLLGLLRPPRPAHRPPPPPRDADRYAAAALEAECREVAATPQGGRNHRLNAAGFSLGQLVGAGKLAEADCVAALMHAAETCGLAGREAERTIASGLAAGQRQPREVPA